MGRNTLILTFLLLLALLPSYGVPSVVYSAETPFPKYYRNITIYSPVNVTDYTIRITFTSSNFDFSHLLSSDGSDIFFLDEDGRPLYFWIEYINTTTKIMKIWVKVSLHEGYNNITMYYGGYNFFPEHRNGTKTFLYFEDFNSTPTGWVLPSGWSVSNSHLVYVGSTSYAYFNLSSTYNTISFAFGAKIWFGAFDSNLNYDPDGVSVVYKLKYTDPETGTISYYTKNSTVCEDYGGDLYFRAYSLVSSFVNSFPDILSIGVWYVFEVRVDQSDNHHIYLYGDPVGENDTGIELDIIDIQELNDFLSAGIVANGETHVDAVWLRKYNPTLEHQMTITIGQEQSVVVKYNTQFDLLEPGHYFMLQPTENGAVVVKGFDRETYVAPITFLYFSGYKLVVKKDLFILENRTFDKNYETVYIPLEQSVEVYIFNDEIVILLHDIVVPDEEMTVPNEGLVEHNDTYVPPNAIGITSPTNFNNLTLPFGWDAYKDKVALFIILLFALLATQTTAPFFAFGVVALALFFTSVGWLNIGQGILGVMIGIAMFSWALKRKEV